MNREDLVSVIVPVYNSARYITECVESVRRQTYADFELILIDDGSEDESRKLCEKISGEDGRFRLICQNHKGVSAARNAGMREAKGEFLFFLDSDDAVHPLLLEELVRQMKCNDAELALCGFRKLDTPEMKKIISTVTPADDRPRWQTVEREMSEKWFHIRHPRCLSRGAMIRRDFTAGVWFDEGLVNGEDTLFLYELICRKPKIAYACQSWYYYRMRKGSATHTAQVVGGNGYCDSSRIIRDREYERKHLEFALTWENVYIYQLAVNYSEIRKMKNREKGQRLKEKAAAEKKHLLFGRADPGIRILFLICFSCYPLYAPFKKLLSVLWRIG